MVKFWLISNNFEDVQAERAEMARYRESGVKIRYPLGSHGHLVPFTNTGLYEITWKFMYTDRGFQDRSGLTLAQQLKKGDR